MENKAVKQCSSGGMCHGGKCAKVTLYMKIPELRENTNNHPGFTYCQESCGFLGWGCLLYRTYAVNLTNSVCEIFSCPIWEYKIAYAANPFFPITDNFSANLQSARVFSTETEKNEILCQLFDDTTRRNSNYSGSTKENDGSDEENFMLMNLWVSKLRIAALLSDYLKILPQLHFICGKMISKGWNDA